MKRALKNLRLAQRQFKDNPNMDTAVALQRAQRLFLIAKRKLIRVVS